MTNKELPSDWIDWIKKNISRGCNQNEMTSILADNGFDKEICQKTIKVLSQNTNENDLQLYIPCAKHEADKEQADLFTVEHFLTDAECTHLIEIIREHLRPSTTTNDNGPYKDYRTSKTCDLSLLDSDFIQEIDRRICKMLGIAPECSEGIQGQWYDIGDEFKEHTDYFEPDSEEFKQFAQGLGQRTWTFMIYLNTTQAGGETYFKKLDKRFSPVQGTAVIWNNLKVDRTPNSDTLHHGMPVKQGYKAIITKWFRTKASETVFREANENIPCHTQQGFLRTAIPQSLFHEILKFHAENKHLAKSESVPGFIHSKSNLASAIIELTPLLKNNIHTLLQPIAEAWSGCLLKPTYVYGIREYYQGAILEPHRDRLQTHEVSLILNVRQQIHSEWPLLIEDHLYRQHEVLLQPGQMILYEGCRLLHGRPTPLDGTLFANIFVHYSLKNQ